MPEFPPPPGFSDEQNAAARETELRARELNGRGEHAAAAALCGKALADLPEHPALVRPHAAALLALQRYGEAGPASLLCARLQPLEPETYAILAAAMRADGQTELAAAFDRYSASLAKNLADRPPEDVADSYGRMPFILTNDLAGDAEAPAADRPGARLLFATELWGGWHLDVLMNCFLPSMLAPGNLPLAGRERPRSVLSISLPVEEYLHLREHPSLIEASRHINVRLNVMKYPPTTHPDFRKYGVMAFLQNHAARQAIDAGAIYFPLPPDTVHADGTVATVLRVLEEEDRKAFYAFSPRVELEEFARFLLVHGNGTGIRDLAMKRHELVHMAMACQHRTQRAMNAAADAHTIWPSSVMWTVPRQGYAVRAFHLAPIAIRPDRLGIAGPIRRTIDADYIPSDRADYADLHVSRDSDEYFGFSLSSRDDGGVPGTQPSWYTRDRVREWLRQYRSPLDLFHASHPIRVHSRAIDESLWAEAEREGAELVDWLRNAI